jgi:membrane-bound lytic murein transglycosylase B
MLRIILIFFIISVCLPARAEVVSVEAFIADMQTRHNFDGDYLRRLLAKAELKKSIIKAMDRPGEGKAWHEYHPLFITEERIDGGRIFAAQYDSTLKKAEQLYGVPRWIIVAIIGVETVYGGNTGSFRVLDALYTLAFHYPRRADFFRQELEEFLLLVREEQIPPLTLKGSYAGAMGIGQFIPSSYRNYSVDFDGNGRRELHDVIDAIGSIAYYLQAHGWQKNADVVFPAEISGDATALLDLGIEPQKSIAELKRMGLKVEVPNTVPQSSLATVFDLQTKSATAYWMGLRNFYVITRYNRSKRYAMAVYLLAESIRQASEQAAK